MKLHKLTCPNCEANLSIDTERKQSFCQYCGTKLFVDDGSTSHTYKTIDEARIKEAEVQQMVELKKLEIEEKNSKNKRNLIIFIICLVVGWPILKFLATIFILIFSRLFY